MADDISCMIWQLTWQLNCDNYYPVYADLYLNGLNVTYIVGLKPMQDPISFRLRPN
jgi:hypothetical protein